MNQAPSGAESSVKELTQRRQDAMGAKQKTPCGFAPLRLCVENFPAEYAAPTGLGSSPTRCDGATARRVVWERMPKAGEGFSFFGLGSTNMPRRRRWGRTPCQNHFALDVWGSWCLN